MENTILKIDDLYVTVAGSKLVNGFSIEIPVKKLTAIIGPSSSGKTTLLKAINRTLELTSRYEIKGYIRLNEKDIYEMDAYDVRRKFGFVFNRPNPFPSMSIYENVLAGYIINGIVLTDLEKDKIVEKYLKMVDLWDDTKYNLHNKYTFMNDEQKQRLCIARALSMEPEVLLLDQPTLNMVPGFENKIISLIGKLKDLYTIILVTHNVSHAASVSDNMAIIMNGELIEYGESNQILTAPKNEITEQFISGNHEF